MLRSSLRAPGFTWSTPSPFPGGSGPGNHFCPNRPLGVNWLFIRNRVFANHSDILVNQASFHVCALMTVCVVVEFGEILDFGIFPGAPLGRSTHRVIRHQTVKGVRDDVSRSTDNACSSDVEKTFPLFTPISLAKIKINYSGLPIAIGMPWSQFSIAVYRSAIGGGGFLMPRPK